MSERFFDELARTLASPMPRRRALRLTGAALVAATVPALRPRSALAGCGPDTPCSSTCHLPPHIGGCGVEGPTGCGSQINCRLSGGCMVEGETCCRGGTGANEDAWICPKDYKCGSSRSTPCNGGTCGCLPPCRHNDPVLGSISKAYDPETQCCTPMGVQPKKEGFHALACRKTLTPRPKYKPTTNGCGSEDFHVPDTWPTAGKGRRANFRPACNKHDVCYGTCKKDKDDCDKAFCRDLDKACKRTWPDAADGNRRAGCENRASLYCAGVALGADSAYWKAQAEACHCCS